MCRHKLDPMGAEETDINFSGFDVAIGIAIIIVLAVVVVFIALASIEIQKPTSAL